MSPTVVLGADAEAAIVAAVAAAPCELVAALGGRCGDGRWFVDAVVPLPNVAARADRFAVPPAAFAAAEARLRADGHTWLGFVHGHPRGDASPSLTDRAALWTSCLQLIVAGDGRGPGAMRAFRLRRDRDEVLVEPLPLVITARREVG